jgi:hypothetical protein
MKQENLNVNIYIVYSLSNQHTNKADDDLAATDTHHQDRFYRRRE